MYSRIKMGNKEAIRKIKEAIKRPSLQRNDDYINSQLQRDSLDFLTLQMGPNCNRKCFHCYGKYGPKRKGLPSQKIVQKALEDAVELEMSHVVLSDGEPIRYENKKVMKLLAGNSQNLPVSIITNAAFARTTENTINWFRYLKREGLGLEGTKNHIDISTGLMYEINPNNYARINDAIKIVFPEADTGKHLRYRLTNVYYSQEEADIGAFLMDSISETFGKRDDPIFERAKESAHFACNVNAKTPIKIELIHTRPEGRMKNHPAVEKNYPMQKIVPKDTGFHPDLMTGLWIGHDGRVSFGQSGQCVGSGKIYGNIIEESLSQIRDKIKEDPVYQSFQIGGARFIYHLAQEIDPTFVITGRSRCEPCKKVFSRKKFVRKIRKLLHSKGVVAPYKEFVSKIDFRKRHPI